jgi:hypothetical protein
VLFDMYIMLMMAMAMSMVMSPPLPIPSRSVTAYRTEHYSHVDVDSAFPGRLVRTSFDRATIGR